MPVPVPPKHISGLSEIAGSYEGFILDLWGVVHDGVTPFADTLPTLAALKKAEKKVWLLSNAPRRAVVIAQKLTEMGISPGMYDGLITSGEASWSALREGLIEQWGRRCIFIGSQLRDSSLYQGLDLEFVSDPLKADFILNSGVEDFSDTADKYVPLLRACARRELPMLCANPDKIVHVKDSLVICAGTLADVYTSMHGKVVNIGKPYPEIYIRCLQAMGTRNVAAVGDSMLTDIAGATTAGLDSILITSGIHRGEFPQDHTGNDRAEGFLASYLYGPNYIMKCLFW